MRVVHVVGARPNFMKVAPLMRAMAARPDAFSQSLVHTGQHYSPAMSRVFFDDLDLPHPDLNLDVGSGSHAWQTAQVMLRFEPVLQDLAPDWVVVVGDVNSTLACALVCAKLGVPLAHVEAGLRSGDWSMPEEINRVLTDRVADLLFTPSRDADANLAAEGIAPERIRFVGNVMIDSLVHLLPRAEERAGALLAGLGLEAGGYALVTLHRPSNVDDPATLAGILSALGEVAARLPVVFPVHPRTRERIEASGWAPTGTGLRLVEPVGYLDFLALEAHARLVLTDSGGVQQETTVLGVPCLTVRENTELPVTVEEGTNEVIGGGGANIASAALRTLDGPPRLGRVPELWDGRAAERIVDEFAGRS